MSSQDGKRRALIVTGEASGDLHGANLIRAAAKVDPGLSFFGVGGKRMADAGCDILIPSEELAVMGAVEVLANIRVIARAMRKLRTVIDAESKPDLVILIDYPGFNLRLARHAKAAGIPVLYYISPKVWAWKKGRVKTIARFVDRLALIFPFEEAYFQGLDLEAMYVGNPLMDEVQDLESRELFRNRYGIETATPVIGLFPGSRRSEIRYNFQTLVQSARLILRDKPSARFLLPVAASLPRALFDELLAEEDLPVTLVENESIYDLANACDAVACVSGTVTLQTALAGTPMVVVYRMSPISFAIARLLVKVPYVSLVNIVAGEEVVRELLQEEAKAEDIAAELLRILDDSGYNQQIQRGLVAVKEKMGAPGCSIRVAKMAAEMSQGKVRS